MGDSNGIMSYVQVPCPTPNYMDEPEGTATPMLTPEEAAKAEKEPVTTPPTTVGAPLTGCYELDSAPPQGYVHKESNLEFNVDRGGVPAVTYEVNTEHFHPHLRDPPHEQVLPVRVLRRRRLRHRLPPRDSPQVQLHLRLLRRVRAHR